MIKFSMSKVRSLLLSVLCISGVSMAISSMPCQTISECTGAIIGWMVVLSAYCTMVLTNVIKERVVPESAGTN